MKKMLRRIALVVGYAFVSMQAANATVINFDDVSGGDGANPGTQINNNYAGVTFSNGAGGNVFARNGFGFAQSSPNVVTIFPTALPQFNLSSGSVVATFSSLQSFVSIDAAPSASGGNPLNPAVARPFMQVFDSANNLISTQLWPGTLPVAFGIGPYQTLSFDAGSDTISRVILSSDMGNPTSIFGLFDNLTFTTSAAVPEPGTLGLIGLGLLGLGAMRRRRRHS